jgi:hypothetical protein
MRQNGSSVSGVFKNCADSFIAVQCLTPSILMYTEAMLFMKRFPIGIEELKNGKS